MEKTISKQYYKQYLLRQLTLLAELSGNERYSLLASVLYRKTGIFNLKWRN